MFCDRAGPVHCPVSATLARLCAAARPSRREAPLRLPTAAGAALTRGACDQRKKTQRLYREEGLYVRKRRGRKRATGLRAPLITLAVPNASWSVDFVHDQFADGRQFRVFNVVDDVTKDCLAAVVDTSISEPRGRGS